MKIPKIILLSLIFACIGITTEVIFTSLSKFVKSLLINSPINWSLAGKTYAWMFFLYAMIPILFKIFNSYVEKYSIITKAVITVFIIYIIEFLSGAFLQLIIGKCPWKYTEGIHVFGFIRLDYFPFWFIFALLIIYVYQILDKRLV